MQTANYKCPECGTVYLDLELLTDEDDCGHACTQTFNYGDSVGHCSGHLQRIWTAVPILYGRRGNW